MHVLLKTLQKGDRRSIGASNHAAALVLEKPELIDVLFRGMEVEDPVLRMRCADAIEKVTAKAPGLLKLQDFPYWARLISPDCAHRR
jgi:hypothetical protein